MRIEKIIPNTYYHLFLRGNNKQEIFHNDSDRARFLFLILFSQSPISLGNSQHYTSHFIKHRMFNTKKDTRNSILEQRYINLVNFSLMPNHFHLTVYEKDGSGIQRYMQRVLNAYTKYYNTRYDKTGHVFSGPYQYRRVLDDNHLAYLSAYVHYNPRELKEWRGREHLYPWSSFQDYAEKNRWGQFLVPTPILDRFESGNDYKMFVVQSGAKAHIDSLL